jgi:hypothetical protein
MLIKKKESSICLGKNKLKIYAMLIGTAFILFKDDHINKKVDIIKKLMLIETFD